MKHLCALCILLLAGGVAGRAEAAVSPAFSFPVARAPHPLALDPTLSDPAWRAGALPGDTPWENVTTRASASEATSSYLLYDDTNLYVAFIAHQGAMPLVATQSTNDVGFGTDDFVGIGIDSSGAGSQAYLFETTPRGVRYQQATENARYRPNWSVRAQIDGDTWRAVMLIPLSALRKRSGPNQVWRVGFFRGIAARGEHYTWAYDPTMTDISGGNWPTFGDLRFWASATGISLRTTVAAQPKARLELFGLSSIGADRNQYQQADGSFQAQRTRSLGADASIPVTPTINFVGTVNPDFSNVEVDQQTIAPQEFARQLAEYRPFFAQGAQFINANPAGYTNLNAPANRVFYSPSIGPFDSGAKIEGAYGLQSIGVLTFRGFNELTGETFDDQAFGYRHSLPDQTFQYWADGVLAHHSIAGTDDTYEAGARTRDLHRGLELRFNEAIEAGPAGSAHSMNVLGALVKPNYQAVLQYADVSPNYNPLDGFTTISDVRGPSGYLNLNGSSATLKSWALFFQGDRLVDRTGAAHQADANIFLNAVFKNGLAINGLGPSTSELRVNGSIVPFNLFSVPLGYGDGTPRPVDVSAAWGNFGGSVLHEYTAQTSRPLNSKYTLGLEYDGTYERSLTTGVLDSQWLRRVSLGFNANGATNATLSLRSVSGRDGFSPQPGFNLAAALHMRTKNGDLYVNFGSPSALTTLDRTIVKYVLRVGGDAGT